MPMKCLNSNLPSCQSSNSEAQVMSMTIFANSAGWSAKPAIMMERSAPSALTPRPNAVAVRSKTVMNHSTTNTVGLHQKR